MSSDTGPLLAGQLARLAGVSTDTLRHYERNGLIAAAPRRANGYRAYPREALQRVRIVRQALALGFTIRELSEILRARAGGATPCARVRQLAAVKLAALDDQLADLTRLRESLARTIDSWSTRIAATPHGQCAGLLDSLIEGGHRDDRHARPDDGPGAHHDDRRTNAARPRRDEPTRSPGHGLGPDEGHAHLLAGGRRRTDRGRGK